MTDSLLISNSNQYAAYTAASKNEKSVSELSKLLRGEKVDNSKSNSEDAGMSMDKVIISKEALDLPPCLAYAVFIAINVPKKILAKIIKK